MLSIKQFDMVIVYFGVQDVRAGRSQKKQWLSVDKKTIKTDMTLSRSGNSSQDGSNLFKKLSKGINCTNGGGTAENVIVVSVV